MFHTKQEAGAFNRGSFLTGHIIGSRRRLLVNLPHGMAHIQSIQARDSNDNVVQPCWCTVAEEANENSLHVCYRIESLLVLGANALSIWKNNWDWNRLSLILSLLIHSCVQCI